MGGSGGQSFN
jgi:ATP-dependent Zn protease